MMNITKTINDYLLENMTLGVDIIYNDLFLNPDGLEIMSRYEPSQAKITEYIDGSSVGSMQIAYFVRSDSANECRNILQAISDKLDNLKLTDSTDEQTEYILSVTTLPNFVSVDDKENVIYTITVNADYKHGE